MYVPEIKEDSLQEFKKICIELYGDSLSDAEIRATAQNFLHIGALIVDRKINS